MTPLLGPAGQPERATTELLPSVTANPESPEHVVQFYESDTFLAEVVVEFLGHGLVSGDPAVVIATPEHRRLFADRLTGKGVDVAQATARGRLAMLDARDTLARFMVGEMPDGERFNQTIGQLLDRLAVPGRRVRAYGEMVNLLWQDGNAKGALRLEELWNDLQSQRGFSLLCAYVMGNFFKQAADLHQVCATHTHVLRGPEHQRPKLDLDATALPPQHSRALAAEIAHRKELEQALRASIKELRRKEAELSQSQDHLQDFVENAALPLHWVSADGTILWANRADQALLGYAPEEYVGRPFSEFHLDPEVAEEIRARWRRNEHLSNREVRLRARDGSVKHVLLSSNIYWRDGSFGHTRCFLRDVTEQKRLQDAREAAAERTERLMKITAANAVTPEQVYSALVDQVAAALGASSAGLWLVDQDVEQGGDQNGEHDRERATLARAIGYQEAQRPRLATVSLASEGHLPVADCIRQREPIWIGSQEELLARYPHLAPMVTPGRSYRISCLPVVVRGTAIGGLAFTFDAAPPIDRGERDLMLLVARYSGQALERLRLLEDNQRGRLRAELLYGLARAVIEAKTVEQVFEAALQAIERALATPRCSILLFDEDGVMRFRAWRGLSAAYRAAVEGHSPWAADALDPQPIAVSDVATDPAMSPYLPLFRREDIGSLAFFPLVAGGRLIGKFMVYYQTPRDFPPAQVALANAIANHVAAACARFASVQQLERTVRFNEMFAGILGHDLRNPLGAIMASAELALRRDEGGKIGKPISRILSSGQRMARMIDQLLDFTRVRVGAGMPLSRKRGDLFAVLRQVTDELEQAHRAALRLQLEGAGDGTFDLDRMSQVFSNLIGNALQHGLPEQGVQVRTDGTPAERLRIQVWNQGAIPAALLGNLFEPMTGGERRRDGSQGLGLGLYISKQIVEAHGGELQVQSDEASGTTFTVILPRMAGGS
jgi:PAS domain S-box-containing protein